MGFYNYKGKDWRKSYTDSRAVDKTCRNHGSCKYCIGNRTYKNKLNKLIAEEKLKEFLKQKI